MLRKLVVPTMPAHLHFLLLWVLSTIGFLFSGLLAHQTHPLGNVAYTNIAQPCQWHEETKGK